MGSVRRIRATEVVIGPGSGKDPARTIAWGRLALSLTLLVATLAWLDPERLWARFASADPGWLLIALAFTSLCYPLLALRWSFLSTRAGSPLTFGRAFREYYVSTLLNQLLPFGVAGDAWRAVRRFDAEGPKPRHAGLGALFADRVSGQLVLWAWVLAILPSLSAQLSWSGPWRLTSVLAIGLLAAVAWRIDRVREWVRNGAVLLLEPRHAAIHVPLSGALVALHVGSFWASARALGLELDVATACRIVPLVLCAGSLPAFFAGWGVREMAAAGLYHLSGMSSGDGASASVLFGLVNLVASAPGIFLVDRPESSRQQVSERGSRTREAPMAESPRARPDDQG
jgi:uncharacterized membrane protein YbhN (UPF0104 family)